MLWHTAASTPTARPLTCSPPPPTITPAGVATFPCFTPLPLQPLPPPVRACVHDHRRHPLGHEPWPAPHTITNCAPLPAALTGVMAGAAPVPGAGPCAACTQSRRGATPKGGATAPAAAAPALDDRAWWLRHDSPALLLERFRCARRAGYRRPAPRTMQPRAALPSLSSPARRPRRSVVGAVDGTPPYDARRRRLLRRRQLFGSGSRCVARDPSPARPLYTLPGSPVPLHGSRR
jgi:hypothetical protein